MLIKVFIFFIVMTSVLHGLLLFKRFRGHRFWFTFEYIWLLIASLGIVLASGEAGRMKASLDYNWITSDLKYNKTHIINHVCFWADMYQNKYQYESWEYNKEDIAQYKKAGNWYNELCNTLADNYQAEYAKKIINDIKNQISEDPDTIVVTKKETERMLIRTIELFNEFEVVNNSRQKQEYEYILIYFLPWLLAIALSLQFTKVTHSFLYKNQ